MTIAKSPFKFTGKTEHIGNLRLLPKAIVGVYGKCSYVDAIRTARLACIPGIIRNGSMNAWIKKRGGVPSEEEVIRSKMYMVQHNHYFCFSGYPYRIRRVYNLYRVTYS